VLYPIEACATVGEMYIAAGRNQLYAKQGRASANRYADEARTLFTRDAALSDAYNKLLQGKWDHMMDQTHIGYTFWNEPPLNAMPAVQYVQPLKGAHMSVFAEGSDRFRTQLPLFDSANQQVHTINIANRGDEPFHYTATASAPWIHIDQATGTITDDQRLQISIDWKQLATGLSSGTITVVRDGATSESPATIAVHAQKAAAPIEGFVENDGIVSIDSAHTSGGHSANGVQWEQIPGFGETSSGMEAFPVTAASTLPPKPQACMDYDFFLYENGQRTLDSVLAPTLSFTPGRGLRYSVAIDGQSVQVVDAWASNTPDDWARAVSDGVHRVSTALGDLAAGQHTIHFCSVDPGVVLERLIVSGSKPSRSYLGPPESAFMPATPKP